MDARKYLAEFLGTFVFFAIGFTSVQAADAAGVAPLLVVPFSFGLGLLTAIYAFGHVSGGHFNPAVTVAMVLDRRTTPVDAIGYIVAQVLGAILAAGFVVVLFSQAAAEAVITAPSGGLEGNDLGAVLLEGVMTAAFLLVILVSTKKNVAIAGIVIPLTLVSIHFAIATLTGASVNPARSIGPAVLAADFGALWIYLVGPLAGAVVAWALYAFVFGSEQEEAEASTAG
jgi:aquaporin Z